MSNKTVLIMAGGTGGHVYPALAVADYLKQQGFKLYWLGTNKGLEAKVVREQGYPLLNINVMGIRGKGVLRFLITPLMLMLALLQAMNIMFKVRPAVVLGMGGFVSGPGGVAAWLMRIPLLIHEQNAIAGLTNQLLAPLSCYVMASFPETFKQSKKLVMTGNPVRHDIVNIAPPKKRFAMRDRSTMRILVLGGSLGAQWLNEMVPKMLQLLSDDHHIEIKHQCGVAHFTATEAIYKEVHFKVNVEMFIEDMAVAYEWADIVIARAGALTIAELSSCGVGSILVPFPYAVDDHQTKNAEYLAGAGAAILIQQKQCNIDKLKKLILQLYQSPERLLQMAMQARELAKPQATQAVANLCMEVGHV